MADPLEPAVDGARLLLPTPPFVGTKQLAAQYGCDIGIANDAGIGNVLVYTRTVDDLACKLGRRVSLLTAPLAPPVGIMPGDDGFAIWRNNPYVDRIVNAEEIDRAIMSVINRERDNMAHFGHMIENIAYYYGIRPRILRPSLYLTKDECAWALNALRDLPRPVICLHPHSNSGPLPGAPWHLDKWRSLIPRLEEGASLFEVRLHTLEDKSLGLTSFPTTLRQMFALVWASDLVVCFDSAIAHVATSFERPAIVLWDPTRKVTHEERCQRGFALAILSRWSYPQNTNVVLLGGHDDELVEIIVRHARERLGSLNA